MVTCISSGIGTLFTLGFYFGVFAVAFMGIKFISGNFNKNKR